MGLDMYLRGEKWLFGEAKTKEDGFEQTSRTLELGYWRKHPDLHGYIVEEFAKGVDECQRIDLELDQLKQIRQAVQERALPHTEGFFFGRSGEEDREPTLAILDAAIRWKESAPDSEIREVYYRASW